MPAQYHPMFPTFWSEAKRRGWPIPPSPTSLASYILTCRHRISEGLYHLPIAYVVIDLGWTEDDVREQLATLVGDGFVKYDDDAEVVLICNALRFHKLRGESSVKGAARAVEGVPSSTLRADFLAAASKYAPALAATLVAECIGWHEGPSNPPSEGPSTDDPDQQQQGDPQRGGSSTATATATATPSAEADAARARRARRPARPPKPDELPADLPAHLVAVAPVVVAALGRIAEAKGAHPPTLAGVGRLLLSFQARDHADLIDEFEHYWVHGMGAGDAMRDVVGAYRNRVKRAQDVPLSRLQRPPLAVVPTQETDDERWERRQRQQRLAEEESRRAAERERAAQEKSA